MKALESLGLLLLAVLAVAVSGQDLLTNESVVKMVKSGLGETLIVSMIQGQPRRYALSPDELIRLKEIGVSEKIHAAMLAKGSGTANPAAVPGPQPAPPPTAIFPKTST